MTTQEKIIVSAYTGVLMCGMAELQGAIETRLGRPVLTHELGSGPVWEEIKAAFKADFLDLCAEDPTNG